METKDKQGCFENDYMNAVCERYLEETGEKFRFSKCVPVLHALPKFDPRVATAGMSVNTNVPQFQLHRLYLYRMKCPYT
jgi:hypothetical protein